MAPYPANQVYIRGYCFEDVTNATTTGPTLTAKQALDLTYMANAVKSIKRAERLLRSETTNEG